MPNHSLPLTPDEFKPYVLKGVWKRYDEPSYQSLKWTLGNFSALLVFACFTSLMTLAQSQCWSLLRYIIAQYTNSPRLQGDSTPDPLLELSQSQAIVSVMPVLSGWASTLFDKTRGLFRTESRHARDNRVIVDPVESPWFGIISILIISFFLVMGVAIPWWLTEGALGAPIVKSKITEECLKFNESHMLDKLNRETRTDEIFHVCRDNLNAGCDSAYYLSDPKITKTRSMICPFTGNICLNNTASFGITHWNISASEMGVNSRSKLLMNHRLTCAPVSLDPFLLKVENRSLINVLKPGSRLSGGSLPLSTMNGPNKFSNEDSGFRMFQAKGPHDLSVLPGLVVLPGFSDLPGPRSDRIELNEFLQRNDGQSFLVVYRAGNTWFPTVVNDPFFAAHVKPTIRIPGSPNPITSLTFYPDHEATALGCVEQFQHCFPQSPLPKPCTDWGTYNDSFSAMFNSLAAQFPGGFNGDISPAFERWDDQFAWSLKEMLASFNTLLSVFEVHRYLIQRILLHKMVPLTQWGRGPALADYRLFDVDREPWVVEVETWFMKALLGGILTIQDGALFALTTPDSSFSSEYIREWISCGRILFYNGDFTNINWIGFWITIASLTLICLVGNQVSTIHGILKTITLWLGRLQVMIRYLRSSGLNENSDAAEMDDLDEDIDNTV